MSADVRITALWPALADWVQALPGIGAVLGPGLLGHNALVYLAYALVPVVWWLLFRTRFGLRLRAVGENPQMVDAAGVSVLRLRYTALTLNGLLCGLAGSYLVLAQNASFSQNMTAGRGFMALAGRWRRRRWASPTSRSVSRRAGLAAPWLKGAGQAGGQRPGLAGPARSQQFGAQHRKRQAA